MAGEDILQPSMTSEFDDGEGGGAGLSKNLLAGAGGQVDIKSLIQSMVLAEIVKRTLAQQNPATEGQDPFRTQLDPFYGLQQGGAFRNPEYAPFATGGLKVLFRGGSPYPVTPQQESAATNFARLAAAGNITDALAGVLRDRRKKQDGGLDIAKLLGLEG